MSADAHGIANPWMRMRSLLGPGSYTIYHGHMDYPDRALQ